MRINCPYCGERNSNEFLYKGDASVRRPETADASAFHEFVHMRDNVAGPMKEFWLHAAGCQAWLIVTRNTVTHQISGVEAAKPAMLARKRGRP